MHVSRDFDKPPFDENGVQVVCRYEGPHENMLMDITVHKLASGSRTVVCKADKETAILMFSGKLTFSWLDQSVTMSRESIFDKKPICLHVPRNVEAVVTAEEASEIMLLCAYNDVDFAPKFYRPEDCIIGTSFPDIWDDTARRDVSTVFDYDTAPYSNLVVGEVYNNPGKWAGYVPHSHPHPELYYYFLDKPQGFGAAFIGDDVYKITDRSFSAIPGGKTHPQVVAPGYRMAYVWAIPHLRGNPWDKTRIDAPEHLWLMEQTPEA